MSYFSVIQKVVPLDDDNQVVLRKLTHGQKLDVIGRATKLNPLTQEASLDLTTFRMLQLAAAIVSWAGPGFAGQPVSEENIRALPPEIAEAIEDALLNWAAGLSEEEKNA